MSEKLRRLAAHRDRLSVTILAQRRALAHDLGPWRPRLALVDQGLNALRSLRHRPIWIIGGVVLLTTLRPSAAGRWIRSGVVAWQLIQQLNRR